MNQNIIFQGVLFIKKLLASVYFKLLHLINEKYNCLHRIIFVVSGITGGLFLYYLTNQDFIAGGLTILVGGGLVEFINKYLKSSPDVILVTQSNDEKDEEFVKKIEDKLIAKLKERENKKND